jgi:hypothetical protein
VGYTSKHPDADVPEGKRLPGKTAEQREEERGLELGSNLDDSLTYFVVLPKKKLEEGHTPDDTPAEPE